RDRCPSSTALLTARACSSSRARVASEGAGRRGLMNTLRILIADDHPLFRDGMHGLLDSVSDTKVVGEAASGEEAIKLAETLQPDVILMDIKMPGINGLQAMREILNTSPHFRILIVSMLEDDDSVF